MFGSTPRPSDSSTLNSSTSPGRKRVSAAQPADKVMYKRALMVADAKIIDI